MGKRIRHPKKIKTDNEKKPEKTSFVLEIQDSTMSSTSKIGEK